MDCLSFREATKHDYDSVVFLMQQLNPDDAVLDKLTGLEIYSAILKNAGLSLLLAELEGQCVCSCYLNVIPNMTRGGQPYAVIENVVTSETHRRKGIGAALLKYAIAKAFEQGCYKVMLMTGRDNKVHMFYENCGMEKSSKTAFVIRK